MYIEKKNLFNFSSYLNIITFKLPLKIHIYLVETWICWECNKGSTHTIELTKTIHVLRTWQVLLKIWVDLISWTPWFAIAKWMKEFPKQSKGYSYIWMQYVNIEEATSLPYHIWTMVCGPYVVTLLNWTPILECYMTSFGIKNL